jgi:hypothetical protein
MSRISAKRRCPRCGGNLYIDRDFHGWYEECLQCSYMKDMPPIYDRKKEAVAAAAKLEN